MLISSPIPMFDHLLESSHRDDSKTWSNIGIGEDITEVESIEVNFSLLIWSPSSAIKDCSQWQPLASEAIGIRLEDFYLLSICFMSFLPL